MSYQTLTTLLANIGFCTDSIVLARGPRLAVPGYPEVPSRLANPSAIFYMRNLLGWLRLGWLQIA